MEKKPKTYFVNCGDNQYLVFEQASNEGYPNNLKNLGIVSKDVKTKLWSIAPFKQIGSSKAKFQTRKLAVNQMKKSNLNFNFIAGQ